MSAESRNDCESLPTTHGLTPAELESHIRDCGRLIEKSMKAWYETGCFSHRGEADYWKSRMYEAIAARTPETVARMERERGLA